MAKRLNGKRITPDFMITSPATRALATCEVFAKVLHFKQDKIKKDKRLYHADASQMLMVIREWKDHPRDDEEVGLLFGHNPGLTEFVNLLLNEHIDNIPTCGIVKAYLHIDRWNETRYGCGKLEFFDFPKSKEE
jgi:phosphohistidine phosphatase